MYNVLLAKHLWRCGAVGLFVSVLSACSQNVKELPVENAIDDAMTSAVEQAEQSVPDEVKSSLLNAQADTGRDSDETERFDLSVQNAPAQAFFVGLVEGTGQNIVVHPNVQGTISLELTNVTIEDVLSVTREIYGYEYKHGRGIYTIYPRELRTEVFQIDYPDIQRVGVSDTSVAIGTVQSSSDNNNNGNNSGNNGSQGSNLLGMMSGNNEGNNGGSQSRGISPGAQVQTLNRTNFWPSLQETITAIIGGAREERMVMVTPQAGMVVVKALPDELNAVRRYLQRSELSVKRQVILETKILEVRLKDEFNAGINWGQISGQLLYGYNLNDGFNLDSATSAQVTPYRPVTITTPAIDSDGNPFILEQAARENVDDIFASLLQVRDISKLLSLLETQGNVQVLSSPRISTVNNQKALIRVGSDEFFVTGISNNTTSNASSTINTPQVELESFFSGIALDVTPQISEDGEIILHIHPVVSDVVDQQKNFTIGDSEFSIPLALRDIRESDSIVRARSGEVVVLGGLMQETVADSKGKHPGFGDVPLVGNLFKRKSQQRIKTELVILLRPIVVDGDTWKNDISNSRDRIRGLSGQYRDMFGE